MTVTAEQTFLRELDKKLWIAACKLQQNLDAAVYKHAVLGLIFLKYVSDSFEERQKEVEAQLRDKKSDFFIDPKDHASKEKHDAAVRAELEVRDYYTQMNVFWVPALARWKTIQDSAKLPAGTEITVRNGKVEKYKLTSLGKLIDDALDAIERENPKLKGVLNKTYTQLQLDPANLGSLIDLIATIPFHHGTMHAKDILGHVYEYFLGQFALAEGKKGGQYYTPKSIVSPAGATKNRASAASSLRVAPSGARLSSAHSALRLGRILFSMRPSPRLAWPNDSRACNPRPVLRGTLSCACEPFKGRVYDPAMGSGGFFVQSEEFIEQFGGRLGDISVYGQESNPTTPGQARGRLWRLAAMNMAIRGIDFNFGKEPANSFTNEAPDLGRTMISAQLKEWWDAKLEVVWACPLAKPRGSAWSLARATARASKSAPVLRLRSGPGLRAFRSNPSREMRDPHPTFRAA